MENNIWIQIKVTCDLKYRDTVCDIMSIVDPGLMIEDYSDIETGLNTVYGELIDEAILNADKNTVAVSVYISGDRPLGEYLSFLRERFSANGVDAKIETLGLDENEWASSWKQYYKPIHIGERIVVCPPWEKCELPENGILVEMDPGMAFGTGSHETTRLVMRLLEKHLSGGENLLDVGCGSGILAICASKLGAKRCSSYDIDPVAVRVAIDNIESNGITNVTCDVSDLLSNVTLEYGKYDFVTANIVAEIIIRMAPDLPGFINDGAVLIVSGIVDSKQADTVAALEKVGFSAFDELHENEWCAVALRYDK